MPTDCGCTGSIIPGYFPIVEEGVAFVSSDNIEVVYCPLHAAAPATAKQRDGLLDMVEALVTTLKAEDHDDPTNGCMYCEAFEMLKQGGRIHA